MRERVIQFRDAGDIRPLPPIPEALGKKIGDMLNIGLNSDTDLFGKLKIAYDALDLYNEFVATFAVCQKACSHCCKYTVSVSRLEAEYIEVNEGHKFYNGSNHSMIEDGTPCPFLSADNSCSIYSSRPFNCRTFHTLDDPKYCANGGTVDHQIYGSSAEGYKVGVYEGMARWLNDVHLRNNMPYRDIRDWFPKITTN